MKQRGLAWETSLAGPCDVFGDAAKVRVILRNLLTNAVTFTPTGGSIRIECAIAPSPTTRLVFRVTNTGDGVPADKLATIFDPFVQGDASLRSANEGLGLGLAVGRGLARAMDGDLHVASPDGKGATFTLELPVAEHANDRATGPPSARKANASPVSDARR